MLSFLFFFFFFGFFFFDFLSGERGHACYSSFHYLPVLLAFFFFFFFFFVPVLFIPQIREK